MHGGVYSFDQGNTEEEVHDHTRLKYTEKFSSYVVIWSEVMMRFIFSTLARMFEINRVEFRPRETENAYKSQGVRDICSITVRPLLSSHPQDFEKWPLNRVTI